jgi:Zn-dependent protease
VSSLSLPNFLQFAIMAVVFIFSVMIHEIAHGYVAMLNGDPTAKIMGRITLNPVPHIDPVGSILLPLLIYISGSSFFIGWAKPVPVNPLNFRDYRMGELTVSAAGPLSNLALAVVFAFLFRLGLGGPGLMAMAFYGVAINVILALFNLIPIPPLDGSHLVAILLPPKWLRYYRYLDAVGFVLILILAYTGLLWAYLMPLYHAIAAVLLGYPS